MKQHANDHPALLARPWRWLVYVLLAAAALLAIRSIDSHVTARPEAFTVNVGDMPAAPQ